MNSLHSRSSSEVEATPFSEIIPVFSKDLRKDFDFNDVKDKVRNLFTDIEYDYIVKEVPKYIHIYSLDLDLYIYVAFKISFQTGEAQILHLIWVLQNKNDAKITTFLDNIDHEYHWIVDKIRREINDHQPETLSYLETLKAIQSENQSHTDYNVHRTKQVHTYLIVVHCSTLILCNDKINNLVIGKTERGTLYRVSQIPFFLGK